MRQLLMVGAVLLAAFAATAAAPAQKPDPKVVEEIQALLDQHDRALSEKNLDALMATMASDPGTVVMGTGPGERWVGSDEIRAAYAEIFKTYDQGTLQVTTTWKRGAVEGNVAWLAAQCNCVQSLKNQKRVYALNVSATVVKRDNRWRFVQLHMSNATDGPPGDVP